MRRRLVPLALIPVLALCALLSPRALAQGTLDQSVTTTPIGAVPLLQGPPAEFGQTFTAGITGTLDSANLQVFSPTAGTTATVSIYATASGQPSGTALASGTLTATATVPLGQMTTVTFAPAPQVTAGQVYALVIGPVLTPPAGAVFWATPTTSIYAGGTAFVLPSGTLTPYLPQPFDFDFQTFVTPPAAAPAPVIITTNLPVTLGVAIAGCGSLTPSVATMVNVLQAIPVTAVPCSGSVFVGWTGGPCSGTKINPCDIAPSGTQTIIATFAP
jgi:hypothetical protein